VIPEGVAEIQREAFKGHLWLRSIEFPSSLRRIYAGAFSNCSSLECIVDLSDTKVWEIGEEAFLNCAQVPDVVFSNRSAY
jgi:hypothetical protein